MQITWNHELPLVADSISTARLSHAYMEELLEEKKIRSQKLSTDYDKELPGVDNCWIAKMLLKLSYLKMAAIIAI